MALTIPYLLPQWQGSPDFSSPLQLPYYPAPGAVWREGDLLISTVTGTVVTPPGNGLGTLAGVAGPLASRIAVTQTLTTGAPGGTYYYQVTDALTGGNETIPSQEFVVNSLPGYTPTFTISATGAPATATSYNLYVGRLPGLEAKQTGSIVAYATPTTLPATLTNSMGVSRAASNPSANIVGIAVNDSTQNFFNGGGGSTLVGNQSLFGATVTLPPLTPAEAIQAYVTKLQGGTYWEFSLRQTIAWSPALVGTICGLYLDPTTNFFVVDTAQNGNIVTIVGSSDGVQTITGSIGDFGKRVLVNFNGTGLV